MASGPPTRRLGVTGVTFAKRPNLVTEIGVRHDQSFPSCVFVAFVFFVFLVVVSIQAKSSALTRSSAAKP